MSSHGDITDLYSPLHVVEGGQAGVTGDVVGEAGVGGDG